MIRTQDRPHTSYLEDTGNMARQLVDRLETHGKSDLPEDEILAHQFHDLHNQAYVFARQLSEVMEDLLWIEKVVELKKKKDVEKQMQQLPDSVNQKQNEHE